MQSRQMVARLMLGKSQSKGAGSRCRPWLLEAVECRARDIWPRKLSALPSGWTIEMTAWWDAYGLRCDPFLLNKPLGPVENDLIVETRSFQELGEYFPPTTEPMRANVLVHGTFGSGKTTLLRHLESRWSHLDDVKVHWLDAKLAASTYELFEAHILGSLVTFVTGVHVAEDPRGMIRSLLATSPSGHHVILVDELHKVDEAYVLRFLRDHQSVLESIRELPITLVLAGQDALSRQFEGKGGVTGVFDLDVALMPMTDHESLELIEKRLLRAARPDVEFRNPFSRSAISRIVSLASGVPRFILKRARDALRVNSVLHQPIVIDEIAIARAEEGLSGEVLLAIRKILSVPTYASTRSKLERIFSGAFGSEKNHDYLAVVSVLFENSPKLMEFQLIEGSVKVFGDLERILTELHRDRIVTVTDRVEKRRLGSEHIPQYGLDEKVRGFFSLAADRYKVEATRFLQRSIELYSGLRDQEYAPFAIQGAHLMIEAALRAYNIETRGEPGETFEARLNNAARDLADLGLAPDPEDLKDPIQNLVGLSRRMVEEASEVTITDARSLISSIETSFLTILDLHSRKGQAAPRKIVSEAPTVRADLGGRLQTLEDLVKGLYAKLEAMELRAAENFEAARLHAEEFVRSVSSKHEYLMAASCPLIIEAFVEELANADAAISSVAKRKDEGMIQRALIRAIGVRLTSVATLSPERQLERKQAITALVAAFEEFLRYVVLRLPQGDLRRRLETNESSLGHILGPILGSDFTSRMMKYNPGGLADSTEEAYEKFVGIVESLLQVEDEKVAALGPGPTALLLLTVIRNFEQHTLRSVNVSDDRFMTIFDQLVLGFLWFFEYYVERLGTFPRIVVACEGPAKELKVAQPSIKVYSAREHETPSGGFLVGDLVYGGRDSAQILLQPRSSSIDLIGLPSGTDTSWLPYYHEACTRGTRRPLDELDEELFLVRLCWYKPKAYNSAVHNGEIAFFDEHNEAGRIAKERSDLNGYYAAVFQSGLSDRFAVITPVRFFTCLEDVMDFLRVVQIPFVNLPTADQVLIRKATGLTNNLVAGADTARGGTLARLPSEPPTPALQPSSDNALDILQQAFDALDNGDGIVHLAALGTAIYKRDSTFDSRTYGKAKLVDLIQSFPDRFVIQRRSDRGPGAVYVKRVES